MSKQQPSIKIAAPGANQPAQTAIKPIAPACVEVQVVARASPKKDDAPMPLVPPMYTGPIAVEPLTTVAFALPVFMKDLHSYYITCTDDLLGIEHSLRTVGEEYAAQIVLRNNVDAERIITVRWF